MKAAVVSVAAFAMIMLGGCGREAANSVEWLTMGTSAAYRWRGGGRRPAAVSRVQAEFAEIERLLNAHSPTSELSRLAPLDDGEVLARANGKVRACYAAAFRMAELTEGRFSPRWRGALTLDLGAIAKGFAVDLAADAAEGGEDALIDLGGNLKAVRGEWRVGVKNPLGGGETAELLLLPGEAVATSATYFRGAHIVDAVTGTAAAGEVKSVSVLGPSAMWADALSTALFILGPSKGRELVVRIGAELPEAKPTAVLWVLEGGRVDSLDPAHRFSKGTR